jgi:hypothetical protein
MSDGLAAFIAMFVPLSSIIGRLSFGWLEDVLNKKLIWVTGFSFYTVDLVFFCYGHTLPYAVVVIVHATYS